MRRLALSALGVVVLVCGCGTGSHAWTGVDAAATTSAAQRYATLLHWSGVSTSGRTGYRVYENGSQIAEVRSSPADVADLRCGTSYTLGVAAHDAHGNKGPTVTTTYATPACPQFPLRVSSNGRYLETARGKPFLLVGDSPQSVVGNLSEPSAARYFADRERHGFNALWINLLCDNYTECASNGETYDDVAPFTSGSTPATYNLSTPNSRYFARAHAMVARAGRDGLAVFLDPIETGGCASGGWMTTLENNGNGTTSTSTRDYRYGEYLGNEFKDLPNVVWLSGNDFQCHTDARDDNDAIAVAKGIHATDPTALQTTELDYCTPANACEGTKSTDDSRWSPVLTLDGVYTYGPTYAEARTAYSSNSSLPMFLEEASYETQHNAETDGCIAVRNCRLQEWWTMTSGATGQFYGGPSYGIKMGWSAATIDSIGARQVEYQTSLLQSIAWWTLVPDTSRRLVTRGSGTCPTSGSIVNVSCVTDAYSADRTLALVYEPQRARITIELSRMAGSTRARWYDPIDGTYARISGSPFANSGSHNFTPPHDHGAGDHDWVLLLQASRP